MAMPTLRRQCQAGKTYYAIGNSQSKSGRHRRGRNRDSIENLVAGTDGGELELPCENKGGTASDAK